MKNTIVVVLLSSAIAFANVRDKVDELLILSGANNTLSKKVILKTTEDSLDALARRDKLSEKETIKMKAEVVEPIKKMNMSSLRAKVYDTYLNTYSESEIDAIIAFYKSPVGKKVRQKEAYIASEIQKATMEEMTKSTPKRK